VNKKEKEQTSATELSCVSEHSPTQKFVLISSCVMSFYGGVSAPGNRQCCVAAAIVSTEEYYFFL
jgi:hypothetical protein